MKIIPAKRFGRATISPNSRYKIKTEYFGTRLDYNVYKRKKFLGITTWRYIKYFSTLENAEEYILDMLKANEGNKNPLIKYYE
ncbi:MAG TPA: hypothetical protein VFV86_02370 [Nitrososphaeraceae archaeon]|nr:hypothetical protein [Nitrososphaeraceae archaeon]